MVEILLGGCVLKEGILNIGHYRCCAVFNDVPGLPIVFLHGYMFTSDIWKDINVLKYLEDQGIPFLAIDMPYGVRSRCSPHTRLPENNVYVLREAVKGVFGPVRPVVVGASLGGYIALKYLLEYPVSGVLLIAPVRVFENEFIRRYSSFSFPIHVIVGTRDRVVSIEEMKKFVEKLPRAKLKIYKDAGHPAYLDKPDEFKKDLMELYRESLS